MDEFRERLSKHLEADGALAATLEQVAAGQLDPYSAVRKILASLDVRLKP